jgi:hypothetical protein
VCILLVAVLHFAPDADDPAGIVAAFRDAVAPGRRLRAGDSAADHA